MTYAIANVVYGIDLTPGWDEDEKERWYAALAQISTEVTGRTLLDDVLDEPEDFGLVREYSGSGESPMWLGVKLGEFDETKNLPFDQLVGFAEVSSETKRNWETAMENVHPDVLAVIRSEFGQDLEPKVYIIWCTS